MLGCAPPCLMNNHNTVININWRDVMKCVDKCVKADEMRCVQ